ncbi:hypothetical protein JHU04_000635 [Brenneria sp. 4F2]|nr:hypothetical protein [Brenneria bubanii]
MIAVEHNLEVIAHTDWLNEMGPGAGKRGGKIIFAGTPSAMLASPTSITAPFLNKYLHGQG